MTSAPELIGGLSFYPNESETMTPEEIKALRERLLMTQAELAAKLGVNLRSYQRWEDATGGPGARKPSGSAIVLLRRLESDANEAEKARLAREARAKKQTPNAGDPR